MKLQAVYDHLNAFDFTRLFIEELGWNKPASRSETVLAIKDRTYRWKHLAELGGILVLGVTADDGSIPDAAGRLAVHKAIGKLHHEHLLIFTDAQRTQSLWFWVKQEAGKAHPRSHLYLKGQPADLFLSKLQALQFELAELDEDGRVPVVEVAQRLKTALDIDIVTKKFFKEFQQQHIAFLELIEGIPDERERRWYASVLLNRLMFVWFLQKKGFIDDGDFDYLGIKLEQSKARGADRYYGEFLHALFFEGFAKPETKRSAEANVLLGKVRYLNGGLFLPHRVEQKYAGKISIPDAAFANLFGLFARYSWNLDDRPGGKSDEINPDVLGYIFEKYINQKAFGAYYTRPEITRYLCEQTLHALILDRLRQPAVPELGLAKREFATLEELLLNLDAKLCTELLALLPTLSVLDPACGSGAFLVAAMKTLVNVYGAVMGRISVLNDPALNAWKKKTEGEHRNLAYHVHKTIITDNLYGVDIMEEAAEIARLRLFLALVACARTVEEIEPLPNIDFNILPGNSLIGIIEVDDGQFDARSQGDMFRKTYREIVAEKNRAIEVYRHTASYATDLGALRDGIEQQHSANRAVLDEMLLLQFHEAGVKYEQATWDAAKHKEGKAMKRKLTLPDITALKPFHWGYEFDPIINGSDAKRGGGFDVILANPPWEVFQTDEKEFTQRFDAKVQKKTIRIEDWNEQFAEWMTDNEFNKAWLSYASQIPFVSKWFKSSSQYRANQPKRDDGSAIPNKLNLYLLFTEQCLNLLRPGGRLGVVVPSGLYTDLGAKGLRELLFSSARIHGLFGFENRKEVFEGVHRSFKFIVLTAEKGGATEVFPTAFMRHDVAELDRFPRSGALPMRVELIRRLSPDSLSVMEFKSETDVVIAEKMLRFQLLGERIDGAWNLRLTQEFNMNSDSALFKTAPGPGRLPLCEGKMIHQFESGYAEPKYWLDEAEARAVLSRQRLALLNREAKKQAIEIAVASSNLTLDYESFRLAFRDVARNTDVRTFIGTVLSPSVFCPHTMSLENVFEDRIIDGVVELNVSSMTDCARVFATGVLNSFVVDYSLRQSVTAHLSFFFLYNLPIPRLTAADPRFAPIVERAIRLICTTPAFDALRESVAAKLAAAGPGRHTAPDLSAATEPTDRARLRAELDGLVAHLYGLTESEFVHILGTFPLVKPEVKDAALAEFRALIPKTADEAAASLIAAGESVRLEFKSTARWNVKENRKDAAMEAVIVKTVAALLNSEGGNLLIGVDDVGTALGLGPDFQTLGQRPNADGYEAWLMNLLLSACGKEFAPQIAVSFPAVAGQTICRVTAQAAPKAAYVEGKLFIRTGNSTRELNPREAVEYARARWP